MKSEMGILLEAVMHEHMIACTYKRERINELKQKTSTSKRKQCDCFIQFFRVVRSQAAKSFACIVLLL